MEKRKSELLEIQKERETAQKESEKILTQLGSYLAENFVKELSAAPFSKQKKRLNSLIKNSAEAEKKIKAIQNFQDEIAGLRNTIKELNFENKDIEKSILILHEDFGAKAYQHYRKDPGFYQKHEALFAEIKTFSEEVSGLDQSISSADVKEKKSFFNRIADTSQKALLKGKKFIKSRNLPNLYQQLGADLAEADLFSGNIPGVSPPDLSELSKQIASQQAQQKSIIEKNDQLEKEIETKQDKLEILSDNQRPEKAVSELENSISKNSAEKTEVYRSLGLLYAENPGAVSADEELKVLYERYQKAWDKINSLQNKKNSILSEIEIGRIEERIKRLQGLIEEGRREIEKNKLKIENYEQEISSLEKEKKQTS